MLSILIVTLAYKVNSNRQISAEHIQKTLEQLISIKSVKRKQSSASTYGNLIWKTELWDEDKECV
jgi:hypothetical protein